MATVNWVGKQIQRAQVSTLTVGSHANGETFVTSVGGVPMLTYIAATATDTSDAVLTANLLLALQGLTDARCKELTFAAGSTSTTISATGPSTGKPFTIAASGTGTYSASTTTAALSPNDWMDDANFDTGAKPTTGDTLVFGGAVDVLYNLDGNTDVFVVRRESTHSGRIGLPDVSDAGYPEYRKRHLELAAVTVTVETASRDSAGTLRFKSTGAAATYNLLGDGTAQLDSEPVELYGLAASSIVHAVGSGVAICPADGQTGAVATLIGEQSAVRVGAGTTLGAATFKGCQWRVEATATSLTQYESGAGEVGRAAACGNAGLLVYAGLVNWNSTGATGNSPVVGQGATINFSGAPSSVTVGGTVEMNAGGSWFDPRHVCGSYNVHFNRCRPQDCGFQPGTDRTVAVS